MVKVIFTVKEDVCLANGKDVNATDLLRKCSEYGTLEDYEGHIKAIKAEQQVIIDNLTAQNKAIKDQNLTSDEINLVNAYRQNKTDVLKEYLSRIDNLTNELSKCRSNMSVMSDKIKAVLDDNI